MKFKQLLLRLFFILEIGAFAWIYIFGEHGYFQVDRLQEKNDYIIEEVVDLEKEVASLEHEIVQWKTNSFYKEQLAREKLQMSRPGDHVYYIQ